MIPVHELLNRIRWDQEFGQGRFEIGFFDRHEDVLHRVAFQEIAFAESGGRTFQFVDQSGQRHRVPFHRIREVYRDGERIWHRPNAGRREIERIC